MNSRQSEFKRIVGAIFLGLSWFSNSCSVGGNSHLTQADTHSSKETGTESTIQANTGASDSTVPTTAMDTSEGAHSTQADSANVETNTSLFHSTSATSGSGAETSMGGEESISSDTSAGPPETGAASASSSSGGVSTGETSCDGLSAIQGDVWLVVAADKAILSGIECLDGTLNVSGTVGDLSGLESLQIITMDLAFVNEGPLAHASGLSALNVIGGSLEVVVNSELEDFLGMENLKIIGSNFRADSGLKTLNGLQNVVHIGGSVFIGSVNTQTIPSLVSVKALGGVNELYGHLKIFGAGISSLEGFDQLTKIGGDLSIIGNQLLPTCSAKALADKTSPGEVQIGGNLADECGK